MPMAIDSAIRPEAASASLAPIAVRPLSTTGKDEAKPTKEATRPATMAWRMEGRGMGDGRVHRAVRLTKQAGPADGSDLAALRRLDGLGERRARPFARQDRDEGG